MKKVKVLILATAIGLGLSSTPILPAAEAAQSTTTILPVNLAVGGTVTASGEYGTHQGRAKAFDKSTWTKWLTFNSPAWLQYELPTAKVITSYSITSAEDAPYRDPKNWSLQGSNDGINWTVLDSRQNQTFAKRHQTNNYTFTNSTPFKYVKFDNFANQYQDGGIIQLAEIKLFGNEIQTFKTIKPTVTAAGGENPANLVDGNSTTKWITYNNTATLQFDFGESVTIDGYALTSATNYNKSSEGDPKSWVLQGSNDNVNWTTLDSKSNQEFKLRHQRKHYLLNSNTTAYRYYKLNNVSNPTGWSVQLSEVEFSRTNDLWHALNPAIEIQRGPNSAIFDQALPNAEQDILAILRKVYELLYNKPTDAPHETKKFLVTFGPEGPAASVGGDEEQMTIFFNSARLEQIAANPNFHYTIRDEIIGMLYHELGHAYQYSNFDIEAVTDSLRYAAGYHNRYNVSTGGNWYNTGTANFIRWIEDSKHPGFIRQLNATYLDTYGLNETQILALKESQFQLITGVSVSTLWSQYQQSLTN
ncbi:discoidin domain-containing protein [Paenibacillus sp. GCM10027627]|uniref:discoidin domain-containing protein n=1 Tax=unclassified Paenibacillus TaxID=185978 RepID=UPI0036290663